MFTRRGVVEPVWPPPTGGRVFNGRSSSFGLTVDTDNLSNGEHMDELFPRISFFLRSTSGLHAVTMPTGSPWKDVVPHKSFPGKYVGAHLVVEKDFFLIFFFEGDSVESMIFFLPSSILEIVKTSCV